MFIHYKLFLEQSPGNKTSFKNVLKHFRMVGIQLKCGVVLLVGYVGFLYETYMKCFENGYKKKGKKIWLEAMLPGMGYMRNNIR